MDERILKSIKSKPLNALVEENMKLYNDICERKIDTNQATTRISILKSIQRCIEIDGILQGKLRSIVTKRETFTEPK